MLCKVSGEYVAFELAEVCSPEIPREISHIPPTEGVSRFIRSGNPVSEIARKKIEKSKNYRTDYPIELLFYTDGRVVQPPDVTLLYGLVAFGQIRFHKIDGHRHVASLMRSKETNAA